MAESSARKTADASRITIAQLMQPEHANTLGNVHGGWILKLVDEAGALTSMRHSQRRVVTVAMDSMTFQHPIRIGDLVTLTAEVIFVGRTSMEVEVQVTAENPMTGERIHTNTAHAVYVALDEAGKPVPVPPLEAETEEQRHRMQEAQERRSRRLSR